MAWSPVRAGLCRKTNVQQLARGCNVFVALQVPQRILMGPGPANANPRVLAGEQP